MRKSFNAPMYLAQLADICGFSVPNWAEKVMISGVSVRPDEAEEGDITIATNPTEVGDVYLSLATACLTRQKYLSSLPQNKEVVSIAVADPQETIRQIEEIV